MKQKAILEIDIDLDQDGITGCMFNDKNKFLITVRHDMVENHPNMTKEGVVTALTHELGHMLAVMFEMPGVKQDFRITSSKSPVTKSEIPVDPADGVIACETEAWDLAFLMLEAARIRTDAMKTYTTEEDKNNIRHEYAMRKFISQLESLIKDTR